MQHNPFSPPVAFQQPKPPSSRRWIFGCGGCGCLLVASLIGIAGLGLHLVETEVTAELARHPAVKRYLGSNVECETSWMRTGEDPRDDYLAFECRGDEGTGVAVVHSEGTGPDGEEEIVDGTLELPDGTIVDLMGEDEREEEEEEEDDEEEDDEP